uniref:Beta-galactoside alpha-2,6-sialyltransferase 1 n=1 Tax=Culicoides sonorensis TaxID=179676 RepID=A0A336MV60_CULSO
MASLRGILFYVLFTTILIRKTVTASSGGENRTVKFSNPSLEKITNYRNVRGAFTVKNSPRDKSEEQNSKIANLLNRTSLIAIPRFSLSKVQQHIKMDPKQFQCTSELEPLCINKTLIFKEKILQEFKRVRDELIHDPNIYHINYKSSSNRNKTSAMCLILKAKVQMLRKTNKPPFNSNLLGSLFPKQKFLAQHRGPNKTCVIVSSAGSMKKSKLGSFIDSHDIVLRFNHAPTETYEKDVGKKTTIRIVNSQVVSKAQFNFLNASIFQNISIGIWDPGKYNASLSQWLSNPDFDLFTNYKAFMMRHPDADVNVIDPRSIWRLWNALQDYTIESVVRKNPPTSGFIGIALLLPLCSHIDIVEYIPSTRLTSTCHYYDDEVNSGCTFGEWHPLAAEKLMVYDMNIASDFSVFQKGIVTVQGKRNKLCDK